MGDKECPIKPFKLAKELLDILESRQLIPFYQPVVSFSEFKPHWSGNVFSLIIFIHWRSHA
jgi:EAL domain-containing protein (putative c-di-GMP-specific phosphodiesterase class I)